MRKIILMLIMESIVMSICVKAQTFNPINGHYYEIFSAMPNYTWHEARDSSVALGGYLATITNQTEQDLVYNLVLSVNSVDCWLGGTDEITEGVWQWITGEQFTYANWRPGEPNNAWSDEDYTAFSIEIVGQWNDSRNWFIPASNFIVEWDFNPCCDGDRGDVNGDNTDANILDLTYLVDRIFRGGPVPGCPNEADVNSDGASGNILDLTFLVDRIFRGGPAPGACS